MRKILSLIFICLCFSSCATLQGFKQDLELAEGNTEVEETDDWVEEEPSAFDEFMEDLTDLILFFF